MQPAYTIATVISICILTCSIVHPSQQRLRLAIREGDSATVQRLLAARVAIDQPDGDEPNPLCLACEYRRPDIVRLLITHGAPMDQKHPPKKLRPLEVAAGFCLESTLILIGAGAPLNKDGDHASPLGMAASTGKLDIAELLLALGARAEQPSASGRTALHAAAINGEVAMIRFLLDKHPVLLHQTDQKGWNALMRAAENGHTDAVKLLLARGAEIPPTLTPGGCSILHIAAACKNGASVVRYLLKQGMSTRQTNEEGALPLHAAAFNGRISAMSTLLVADPESVDIPLQATRPGNCALHQATQEGHIGAVELLLIMGAKPNRLGYRDKSPLHYAAAGNHEQIVKLLLKQPGILVDQLDEDSATPLALAAQKNNKKTVKALLRQGSSIPEGPAWDALPEQAKACIRNHLQPAEFWAETALQGFTERYRDTAQEVPHDLAHFICSFATNVAPPQPVITPEPNSTHAGEPYRYQQLPQGSNEAAL